MFTKEMTIPFYQCDKTGNIKISSLINDLLYIASLQLNETNYNDDVFANKQLGWVIIDYNFYFKRLPRVNEHVALSTHVVSFNNMFVYRQFFVHDDKNNLIVSGLSSFVIMDLDKRKITKIDDDFSTFLKVPRIKRTIKFPKAESIESVSEGNILEKAGTVSFFDIDTNGHVNNSIYIDWMENALPFNFLSERIPKQLSIRFKNEIMYGSNYTSQAVLQDKTSIHEIIQNDKVMANAKIDWR